MMIGKIIVEGYVPNSVNKKVKLIELKGVTNDKLKDVSFSLYEGEILGFYGLIGAGKSEIARAILGADRYSGKIFVEGRELKPGSTLRTLRKGIAMSPEERRTQGVCTMLPIAPTSTPRVGSSRRSTRGPALRHLPRTTFC